MSEYEIGKEMEQVATELRTTRQLLEQLYTIVEHNLKEKKLEEPEVKKKE